MIAGLTSAPCSRANSTAAAPSQNCRRCSTICSTRPIASAGMIAEELGITARAAQDLVAELGLRKRPEGDAIGRGDSEEPRPGWTSLSEVCICISDTILPSVRKRATIFGHDQRLARSEDSHAHRIRADVPKVWTPRDFVDLASRDAIDKALQRLTMAETLRRIDRGLYDQPGFNKLTQKANPPDPRSVIDAVGRRDQTRMLVDGMTAANDLGLTDAVPAKIVVHTDARRRAIKLGNVTITFRPTAASKLFWAGRPAMRVVQALHWLRDLLVREGESDQVKRKLAKLFEDPIVGPSIKADLTAGMTALPTWMRVFLKPLIESDPGVRGRHIDDDRDDADHVGADHDRHRQEGRAVTMISVMLPSSDRSRNRSPPRRNEPPSAAQPGQ